ncbi:MAG TPA: hypothetical protein ENN67_03475 [Firmicutes bacterium]|nr:hypothetical protein [Bacillota bacterium]
MPVPPKAGSAFRMTPFNPGPPRIGMKAISRQPITLVPKPWKEIDRELIIASWELIKGQAKEELGYDPGKSLEMIAVFPFVDMDCYDKVDFDLEKRKLKLFPAFFNATSGPDRGHCAIIVGAIQRTRRLFIATLPLESDSV